MIRSLRSVVTVFWGSLAGVGVVFPHTNMNLEEPVGNLKNEGRV